MIVLDSNTVYKSCLHLPSPGVTWKKNFLNSLMHSVTSRIFLRRSNILISTFCKCGFQGLLTHILFASLKLHNVLILQIISECFSKNNLVFLIGQHSSQSYHSEFIEKSFKLIHLIQQPWSWKRVFRRHSISIKRICDFIDQIKNIYLISSTKRQK